MAFSGFDVNPGGAVNLNIHYHMLFLDGIYIEDKYEVSRLRQVKAPTSGELSRLAHTIAQRVGRLALQPQ